MVKRLYFFEKLYKLLRRNLTNSRPDMFNRKRSLFFVFSFVALALLLQPVLVKAQGVMRIAAVVNDDVISALDLAQRIRLTIAMTRIPNTPQVRKRLASNILRTMIDERLKAQEAERLELEVSAQQVENGVASYARSQNINPKLLPRLLSDIAVDREILEDQASAEIAWGRVVGRTGGERIEISETEIDTALKKQKENFGKAEYLYAEIYIPVETQSQDRAAFQMASSLLTHIRNGSPFSALARDFSQSPSAILGGNMGWAQSGNIETPIETALSKMSPGTVSSPVKTPSGYYLLNLMQKRIAGADEDDELLDIAQATLPFAPNASAEIMQTRRTQASNLAYQANSCENVVELGKKIEGANASLLKGINLSKLPADIRQTIAPLGKNQITTHEKKEGAILVLMVCERNPVPPVPEITKRKEMKSKLRADKIGRESRRQLQKLRRSAFVDIRL